MNRLYRVLKVGRSEVWPAAIGEVELGVGALPQQEIAEALFAARSDQKVDVATFAVPMVDLAHRPREFFARDALLPPQPVGGSHQCVASGIVDSNPQIQAGAMFRRILCRLNGAQQFGRNAVAPSNDAHPNVVRD